ncbi:MAG: OmpH family outer membrane protein [Myxococcales bacterium]|nr:OmpH family outer membrane protein [Myxococcales bacterium]MCB9642530.1 OmpH family outer membrane protein [Myxococcales bacterium]
MEFLFVDVSRVLGDSVAARLASEALQKRWQKRKDAAEARRKELVGLPELEQKALAVEIDATLRLIMQELEEQRQLLRHEVLEKASTFAAAVAKQRGAGAVLRVDSALYIDPALDITETVIALLDKAAAQRNTPPHPEEVTVG